MVRGFYSAASGVLSRQKNISVISNNIANASTTGFKSQSTVGSSFGEHLVSRIGNLNESTDNKIGSGAYMTINSTEFTDYSQGSLENTGRSVDLAISGEGFFLIGSDPYGEVLTRNGQFEIDQEGYLVLPGDGRVLNEQGDGIQLSSTNFTVDAQGLIHEDGEATNKLYIAKVQELSELSKIGENVYRSRNGYEPADTELFKVVQGSVEKSNINMAQEMSKIIASQSNFQSNSQIIKMYDKINEITVNQIGRID